MNLTAAVAQIDVAVGDLKRNADHHLAVIDDAVRKKARLVVFPELSLTGYTVRDLAWDLALNPHEDRLFSRFKKRSRDISIALGFIESGSDHGIYNSAVFLEDGEIKHIHRKIYPPTYGMFEEGRYFGKGRTVRAFDSKWGRFGMLICEDLWHVSLPYLLAMDGAETIMSLTASPTRMQGEEPDLRVARINHEHHRVFARLLSSYILFSNRTGFEDGVSFWGGSTIISPSGEHLVEAGQFKEDLILAPVSSEEVQRARRFSRHLLDEDPQLVSSILREITRSA